jgi:hypothetical protein
MTVVGTAAEAAGGAVPAKPASEAADGMTVMPSFPITAPPLLSVKARAASFSGKNSAAIAFSAPRFTYPASISTVEWSFGQLCIEACNTPGLGAAETFPAMVTKNPPVRSFAIA